MALIEIRNLLKRYGHTVAVDNISFDVAEGEVFGFLGPNGAGKSTTISMLCGLLPIDQGEITIDGLSLRQKPLEVKKRLGLVPQEIAVFENLTAWENVEFFGKLAGLRGQMLRERVAQALEFVGLTDKAKAAPKGYSGGMKRRLNIACAIVHQPKIIVMDESTVGIDPQSRNHILESVRKLNEMGSTIIYTSHYMDEVEAICSRIAIIDHGQLIARGTRNELRELVAEEQRISIEVDGPNHNALTEIKQLMYVTEAAFTDDRLEIMTSNAQAVLQDTVMVLSRQGVKIRGIELAEANLETVFLSLTGRKLRD